MGAYGYAHVRERKMEDLFINRLNSVCRYGEDVAIFLPTRNIVFDF